MTSDDTRGTSGWVIFAATMMFVSSVTNFSTGMTFAFNPDWVQLNSDGDFALPIEAIGWINLAIGVLLVAGAIGLLRAATWARIVGVIAGAAMVINGLFTIPVYPGWGFVVVALGVMVIYAVTVKGSAVAPKQEVVGPGGGGIAAQSFQQELPGEEVVDKGQELDDL